MVDLQKLRIGAWKYHLLRESAPDSSVDFEALAKQVPSEGWPPGQSEGDFTGSTPPKVNEQAASATTLGKLLAAKTGGKNGA